MESQLTTSTNLERLDIQVFMAYQLDEGCSQVRLPWEKEGYMIRREIWYRKTSVSEAEVINQASANDLVNELHNMRRARSQFTLEVCWMPSTQSEYGCGQAINAEDVPDNSS